MYMLPLQTQWSRSWNIHGSFAQPFFGPLDPVTSSTENHVDICRCVCNIGWFRWISHHSKKMCHFVQSSSKDSQISLKETAKNSERRSEHYRKKNACAGGPTRVTNYRSPNLNNLQHTTAGSLLQRERCSPSKEASFPPFFLSPLLLRHIFLLAVCLSQSLSLSLSHSSCMTDFFGVRKPRNDGELKTSQPSLETLKAFRLSFFRLRLGRYSMITSLL